MLMVDLERQIQAFENKCYRGMLGISFREHKTKSLSSAHFRSLYCQPSSVASYHGSPMCVLMIRCQRLYYEKQWMAVNAEKERINHGRTTSRDGKASRCRHCRGSCIVYDRGRWAVIAAYASVRWVGTRCELRICKVMKCEPA